MSCNIWFEIIRRRWNSWGWFSIQYSNVLCKKCENSKEIGIQYSSVLCKKRENSKEVGIQYSSVLSNKFSVEEDEEQRKVIVFGI